MLWSRFFLFTACVLVLPSSGFAANSPELDQKICAQMLGATLRTDQPQPEFNVMEGIGLRGFLGSWPEATASNASLLAAQGVMDWGHSFAVKKTIEEARAHDARFEGLAKIMYLISDVDVSDLNDDTDLKVVRERFEKIFAKSDLIYFDDSESILQQNPELPAKLVYADKALAQRLILPELVDYFTKDDRGPRFSQSGWTFPKIRGELIYANVFESSSKTIKKILKEARTLAGYGHTYKFNQNFRRSLNLARRQLRLEKDENGVLYLAPPNSRYLDQGIYQKALDAYASGNAFSIEERDSKGRLIAGVIAYINGNLINFDTIFYTIEQRPGGSFDTNLDGAKRCVLAGLWRLQEKGINIVDAGMVSHFTASLKGVYVPAAQFAEDVEELRQQEPIDLELSKDWDPRP